jgi:hypothetical protein
LIIGYKHIENVYSTFKSDGATVPYRQSVASLQYFMYPYPYPLVKRTHERYGVQTVVLVHRTSSPTTKNTTVGYFRDSPNILIAKILINFLVPYTTTVL